MSATDYLSPTENPREAINAPDLGGAFSFSAPDNPPNLRREYTIQNRLLNSYTTKVDDVSAQYAGLDLEERRALIAAEVDELGQYDNASNLELALEQARRQVDVLSTLDVSNDKARDVQNGYQFAWNNARPVNSLEEAREISYSQDYMDGVKAGYDREGHALKIGEINYDLNDGNLKAQFTEQFKDIEPSAQHAYTVNPLWEQPSFADKVNEDGSVDYTAAVKAPTPTRDEFGCIEIKVEATDEFKEELAQVDANIKAETQPENADPVLEKTEPVIDTPKI